MPNYQNGKIYRIVNDVDDYEYIGSTVQRLCKRMCSHRVNCRAGKPQKIYKHMRLIGVKHFKIYLIEEYPCDNKEQLHRREGYHQKLSKQSLNSQIAGRTYSEYYADNRETKLKNVKKWYEDNKENKLKYLKQYRENNPEYFKKYRENNKDKIKARTSKKIQCECGREVSRSKMSRHKRTKIHNKIMKELSTNKKIEL